MVEDRCPRCRFHGTLDGGIICDYLQITGKSRLSQIPREEWDKPCRLFERGRKVPLKFKPVVDSQKEAPRYRFDQRKMRILYDQGLRDYQIAMIMGCTRETVRGFRRRNHLPGWLERPDRYKPKEEPPC